MEEVQLQIPAQMKYLPLATCLCREMCTKIHKSGLGNEFVQEVELCISEACTNAIKHGSRKDADDKISLRFQVFKSKVKIIIGDKGEGFDLENIPEPDVKDLPEGGYGLYIIKAKMDKVKYERRKGGNYLEMVKYFRDSSGKGRSG